MDLPHPQCEQEVTDQQAVQNANHTTGVHVSKSSWLVRKSWSKIIRVNPRWIPGVVFQQLGPLTYSIKVRDGNCWKGHIDQLRGSSRAVDLDLPDSAEADVHMCWPSVVTKPPRPETTNTNRAYTQPTNCTIQFIRFTRLSRRTVYCPLIPSQGISSS